MDTTLRSAAEAWRAAADALIVTAERAGPLQPDVFGDQLFDDGDPETRFDGQVDSLLRQSDEVFGHVGGSAEGSVEDRQRLSALLIGNLQTADALLLANDAPDDVFGDLGIDAADGAPIRAVHDRIADFEAAIVGPQAIAGAQVTLPAALSKDLEKLEATGAEELGKLLTSATGKLAGASLVSGLEGVLKGAAAATFSALRSQLDGVVNMIRRGVVRITAWVVEKLAALLPPALRDKLDSLLEKAQERLGGSVDDLAADLLGKLLGRGATEAAWTAAIERGDDLAAATARLDALTATHVAHIGWVTTGREFVDRFDAKVMTAVAAALVPQAKLAFAGLVAAVIGFVAVQVWDGFNDIEALVTPSTP
ncbi:MAG: hypothetical protein ABIS47_08345 [Acidimicrobiales bacterium]